ncbi:hypothetical protein ACLSZQ_11055, partial [Avibacterium volantium]
APSAPTVEIQDGNDGYLNKAEVEAGVEAKITFNGEEATKPVAGDTLKVDFDNDGVVDKEIILSDEDIQNGVMVTIPADKVPANGKLTVSATVVDQASNPSQPGTDSTIVDTKVPGGNDGNGDG